MISGSSVIRELFPKMQTIFLGHHKMALVSNNAVVLAKGLC